MKNLKQLLCGPDTTLINALEIINSNSKLCVFVVREDMTMLGLLTEGDIRRLIISGVSLHDTIGEHANKDYVYITDDESEDETLSKFEEHIFVMPVLNADKKVVDYTEFRKGHYVPVAQPELEGNEFKYLVDAFFSTWISSKGEYITRFENDFARFCGCKYGVAVTNGTVALQLALLSMGVGEGDEIIVPDLTFAAVANAALYVGAVPVIVDIERESWNIDPCEIEKAITPRTKAVIAVHSYGQPCDMSKIMELADKHGLYIIEDCAEAHGAKYAGKRVGSIGNVGCFSFYGNKVITTGEGGMCVTNDEEAYKKMLVLRDHGMSRTKRFWHNIVGYNFRMTNLQAAIGVAQLERIDVILKKRAEIEELYRRALSGTSFKTQRNDLPNREKINWMVCVLTDADKRDRAMELLAAQKIETRPFFYPLGDMEPYKDYVFSNSVSREISSMGISLPTRSYLEKDIIKSIAEVAVKYNS